MNFKTDVIILGAGISGLAAAVEITEKGKGCVVIEKKNRVGGVASSFDYKGFILDYGPHGFHSDKPELVNYFKKYFPQNNFKEIEKKSEIFFRGRYYRYPLRIMEIISQMNYVTIILAGISFVYRNLKFRFGLSKDGSAKEWIYNRYGKVLYDVFFGPYTIQVWGVDPDDLAADFAQDRIPDRSLFKILKSILCPNYVKKIGKTPSGRVATHDVDIFLYPDKGIRELSNNMAKYIENRNGKFLLSSNIRSIFINPNPTIILEQNGRKIKVEAKFVISTIPIHSFFNSLNVSVENIKENIRNLKIRSLIFFYVFLDQANVLPVQWTYFYDKKFNRISEISKFSNRCVPSGKTALCVEISCDKNDLIYKFSDDEIFEYIKDDLKAINLFDLSSVFDYTSAREENAYVIYTKTYKHDVSQVENFIQSIPTVVFAGRQGMFKYINMDQAIESGQEAASLILKQL